MEMIVRGSGSRRGPPNEILSIVVTVLEMERERENNDGCNTRCSVEGVPCASK